MRVPGSRRRLKEGSCVARMVRPRVGSVGIDQSLKARSIHPRFQLQRPMHQTHPKSSAVPSLMGRRTPAGQPFAHFKPRACLLCCRPRRARSSTQLQSALRSLPLSEVSSSEFVPAVAAEWLMRGRAAWPDRICLDPRRPNRPTPCFCVGGGGPSVARISTPDPLADGRSGLGHQSRSTGLRPPASQPPVPSREATPPFFRDGFPRPPAAPTDPLLCAHARPQGP